MAEKIRKFNCHLCDYNAKLKGDLNQHVKEVHLKIRDHVCNLCNYKASRKSRLELHIKAVHNCTHECDQCDYKAAQKITLTRHIESAHKKIRPFSCHLCDYKASRKDHLKRHIKVIHEKIKFPCHMCDYKASLAENLRAHVRRVHDKKVIHDKSTAPKENVKLPSVNRKKKSCSKRHLCGLCSSFLPTSQGLFQHLKEIHQINVSTSEALSSHPSGLCSNSLPAKDGLDEHLGEVHKIEVAPMKQNKQYSEEHMDQALQEIMVGEPVYRCSKKYNIPVRSLIDRMKSLGIILAPAQRSPSEQPKHGMNFTCGICDSSFDGEEALFEHLREDNHDGIDALDDDDGGGSLVSPETIDLTEATDEYVLPKVTPPYIIVPSQRFRDL